jgi:hypothetical protein
MKLSKTILTVFLVTILSFTTISILTFAAEGDPESYIGQLYGLITPDGKKLIVDGYVAVKKEYNEGDNLPLEIPFAEVDVEVEGEVYPVAALRAYTDEGYGILTFLISEEGGLDVKAMIDDGGLSLINGDIEMTEGIDSTPLVAISATEDDEGVAEMSIQTVSLSDTSLRDRVVISENEFSVKNMEGENIFSVSDEGVTIYTDLTVSGDLNVSGTLDVTGNVTAGTFDVDEAESTKRGAKLLELLTSPAPTNTLSYDDCTGTGTLGGGEAYNWEGRKIGKSEEDTIEFCVYNTATCPTGTTQYKNWTAATSYTCGVTSLGPSVSCLYGCTAKGHTLANKSPTTCTYKKRVMNNFLQCNDTGGLLTCAPTVTRRGCGIYPQ